MKNSLLSVVAVGVGIGAAIALLISLATLVLWNWLMPTIFGLPTITYWQGMGLLVLSSLLFGAGSWLGRRKN